MADSRSTCSPPRSISSPSTALTPADKEHRFGHGKAEPLAGLAQAAFIAASALFLVVQGVQRLLDPQPVENSAQALAVMAISIALAMGLVVYQGMVVRKTGSLAVHADADPLYRRPRHQFGVVLAIVLAACWVGNWPIPSSPSVSRRSCCGRRGAWAASAWTS